MRLGRREWRVGDDPGTEPMSDLPPPPSPSGSSLHPPPPPEKDQRMLAQAEARAERKARGDAKLAAIRANGKERREERDAERAEWKAKLQSGRWHPHVPR